MSAWRATSLAQALMLVTLGAGLGLAANQISPRGIPWVPPPKPPVVTGAFISLARAMDLWSQGSAVFLDAREPADYAGGHIGNALNLPAQSFAVNYAQVASILTPDSELVLYCDGSECDLSLRLADSLRQQGHTNALILLDGWTAWRKAGLPITPPRRQ